MLFDMLRNVHPINSVQYLPTAELEAGVREGSYHQGHFNPNPYNYLEVRQPAFLSTAILNTAQGSVNVQAFTKPVLLVGRQNMNRSTDGDVVVVELFAESEWKAPTDEVVDQDCACAVVSIQTFLLMIAQLRFATMIQTSRAAMRTT